MGRSLGLLLARFALATIFLYTGWQGLFDLAGTTEVLAGMGYPMPRVMAMLAVAAQLGGGIALVLGLLTRLGCVALILFLIPTTLSFHRGPGELIGLMKNVGIIGGLLALMVSGAGAISVDALVRRRPSGAPPSP